MQHLGIQFNVKNVPELDRGFIPLLQFDRAFLAGAKQPLDIAVERSGGQVAVFRTKIHATADMAQAIEEAPVLLRESLPEEPIPIIGDGDRLYRVFQNLLQNALKYALEGSRVYLALTAKDGVAEVAVKNTSRTELPDGVDFTARFVRGDQSRTDGGSGLGLAIADSFTRACGGELFVEPVADLFVVRVTFPLSRNEPEVRAD